jgi:hypothetical protein
MALGRLGELFGAWVQRLPHEAAAIQMQQVMRVEHELEARRTAMLERGLIDRDDVATRLPVFSACFKAEMGNANGPRFFVDGDFVRILAERFAEFLLGSRRRTLSETIVCKQSRIAFNARSLLRFCRVR